MVKTYLFTSSHVRFRRIEPKKCFILSRIIHVQYTQTESICLRHCTTRLDSHGVVSRADRLPVWRIDSRGNDSCRFDRIDSIESTRIDNFFNPPSRPRSALFSKSRTNRLPACRVDRRGNDSSRFEGKGFTNRFPVSRTEVLEDEYFEQKIGVKPHLRPLDLQGELISIDFYYIHTEIYTLESRRVNFRS